MDQVRQYLLTVLSAAIFCSIIFKLIGSQNLTSGIIKLIASIFLAFSIISPIIKLEVGEISSWIGDFKTEASAFASEGKGYAANEVSAIIKEKAKAYILEKAASLGVDIRVTVEISDPESLIPDRVILEGYASPYAKQSIQNEIAEELGIPKENQIWK